MYLFVHLCCQDSFLELLPYQIVTEFFPFPSSKSNETVHSTLFIPFSFSFSPQKILEQIALLLTYQNRFRRVYPEQF